MEQEEVGNVPPYDGGMIEDFFDLLTGAGPEGGQS